MKQQHRVCARIGRIALLAVVALAAFIAPAGAASEAPPVVTQYTLGDQTFAISAGPVGHLFLLPLDPSLPRANLTLGGTGSLAWAAYVTGQIRLGLEVGGLFAFSPNLNTLLMLPILARGQYVFTRYPFEVPVGLGLGMNIVKYQELSTIDLLAKPEVSALWIYDSKWSFGLALAWWFDMQFSGTAGQSRAANFLELSLSALYHY